ncbi:AraC family transcriptional regulator [Chitinophaga sp. 212800010-3]|uniref:AraC family transcriptional regulator n=1 Tax=unclassified Chitinophaga TaxID=2619133 RepID=UPI002DE65F77|nr:HTH araC/xylS-type domain-containing protein [Chitinophaga sp. 212800010-3]
MKPVYAKILEGLENEVYATRFIDRPYFTTEFHFHEECQITYIVESAGHKVIGDCVEDFEPGELTFLGAHIPHVWYNSPATTAALKNREAARSVALFFHPDKLISLLAPLLDVSRLQALFEEARRGMKFYGKTKEALRDLLLRMSREKQGLSKVILLLELLQVLCSTKKYKLLAGAGYTNTYTNRDNLKMDKVFRYVFDNYSAEIRLDMVASLACMNKQAFCRYFKSRTQKTFIDFVNEVRITQACKLLVDDQYAIGTIAFQCGFNSLTNFNRFFKKMKGIAPREYRTQLQLKES